MVAVALRLIAVSHAKSMDLVDTDEKKAAKEGIIALQYHAPGLDFEVRFKDVRIKILNSTNPK